ncbi:hypothetical protein SK128_016949, partial [Halocaridina rubra]
TTSEQNDLQCGVCSRVFDRRSRLDAHYKTHTGERPFTCPFCGKNFASKGNCNTHMRVHTRERPYQCPHCDKRFSQHGQLVIHIRRHTGEKPYICPHCNKGFTCSKVLKIHVRTHTGEKPFQCEYCHKGFAAYANLVVHRRIHTRERPYSCHLCGRAFEHSGNLSRHVRVHRVDNGVRCIPCGQVFSCDQDLVTHTAHVHPNEHTREEETELEESPVGETTINMEEFQQFQPPHGIQSLPPSSCETQLTVLTPMAPPVSTASVGTVLQQATECTDETRDSGACVTLSDSEDSGRESSGSMGYSASPDQPFDRLSHQLAEPNNVKSEKQDTAALEVKSRILPSAATCESPRETLPTTESSGPSLSTTTIRMPPKKQQYPGGNRSPLTVLQAALSSQKQLAPSHAQPIVSHCQVSSVKSMTPPTVSVPAEPMIQHDTSAPDSPNLNIHQLSLSQQPPTSSITPVGLGAAPQSMTEKTIRASPNSLSHLYRGQSSPNSQASTESNPLDLSQPANSQLDGRFQRSPSQTSAPLNLSQRLENPTSRSPESPIMDSSSELIQPSHHLLLPATSLQHPTNHLLTAAVPTTPTTRSNILRRKSADVGHNEAKKNKSRKVAPPPLIPIQSSEESPNDTLPTNTSTNQPFPQPAFQPVPQACTTTTTSTTSLSAYSEAISTTSTISHMNPTIQISGSMFPINSTSNSIANTMHSTQVSSQLTHMHSSNSSSLPTPLPLHSHPHHEPYQPPPHQPLPQLPAPLPHVHPPPPAPPPPLSQPPPLTLSSPQAKVEDLSPDIIIESDVPKDKLLTSPKKSLDPLEGFSLGVSLGVPSPMESMRENIQRSLMSLLPVGNEVAGFKRKVETALVVLVGDAPMKQMGYPEKTAEQVRN